MFNLVPNELIQKISSYLSPITLCKFAQTSKKINEHADNPQYWKNRLHKDFKINTGFLQTLTGRENCLSFKDIYKYIVKINRLFNRRLINWQVYHSFNLKSVEPNPVLFLSELTQFSDIKETYKQYLEQACLIGNINLVKWLVAKLAEQNDQMQGRINYLYKEKLLNNAILSGNPLLIRWLVNDAPRAFAGKMDQEKLKVALQLGNIKLITYLLKEYKQLSLTINIITKAIEYGNTTWVISLIKQDLLPSGFKSFGNSSLSATVKGRHWDLMWLFLEKVGMKPDQEILKGLVNSENYFMVYKFMKKYPDISPTQRMFHAMVTLGNIDIISLLLSHKTFSFNTWHYSIMIDSHGLDLANKQTRSPNLEQWLKKYIKARPKQATSEVLYNLKNDIQRLTLKR